MTTRDGLWVVVAAVGCGLAAGCRHCVHAVGDGAPFAPHPEPPALHAGPPTAPPVPAGSPYHPRSREVTHFRPARAERTDLPDFTPRTELPRIMSPAEQPGQAAVPPPPPREGPPLVEALACLLNQRPDDARRWLERYDAPNRDLLRGLLLLAVRLAQEPLPKIDPQDADALLIQLHDMEAPLRPLAALTIDKMRFCRRIDTYGGYEPLPDGYQFRALEQVQVYVELRNFTCAKQGGIYLAHVASTLEILDAAEKVVWSQDLDDRGRPEPRRTAWQEYFRDYRFYLPERIPPGLYTLRVWVKDMPTGRMAKASMDFRVTTVPGRGT